MAARQRIARLYDEALAGLAEAVPLKTHADRTHAYHLYVVRLLDGIDRDRVFARLRAEGIGANVHYAPVYLHSHYARLGYRRGLCPAAEAASRQILTLPMFPAMTEADVAPGGGRAHQSDGVSTVSSDIAKEDQSSAGRGVCAAAMIWFNSSSDVTPTRPNVDFLAATGQTRAPPPTVWIPRRCNLGPQTSQMRRGMAKFWREIFQEHQALQEQGTGMKFDAQLLQPAQRCRRTTAAGPAG